MGRPCTVCQHPDLEAIDQALVGRTSYRSVAGQHGLDRQAVGRHAAAHLSPALAVVAAEREDARALDLVDVLHRALSDALAVLAQARAEGHAPAALAAVDAVRKVTMDVARLTGRLDERTTVQVLNVTQDESWVRLRSAILAALAPYPEARMAVAEAVREAQGVHDASPRLLAASVAPRRPREDVP